MTSESTWSVVARSSGPLAVGCCSLLLLLLPKGPRTALVHCFPGLGWGCCVQEQTCFDTNVRRLILATADTIRGG